jgi:hypothetical protein|tara:strand:- start:677 stop:1123 length:447 start_codon:yes stop_codon:yes gene_type:complete
MNINKIFLFLIILLLQVSTFSTFSYGEETANEDTQEEKVNLDEEELPAIDPFQSSSAGTSGASPDASVMDQDMGLLSGFKLVGVIIGKNKKLAVLSSKEGFVLKFEENDKINKNIELQEIYTDHLLIKDEQEKFYQVYMNDIIRSVDG